MKTISSLRDRDRWLFLRQVLAAPRYVGSVTPSSRYLVEALMRLAPVASSLEAVELGPGTGPFTAGLLERLPAHSRLLCIERDRRFVAHLESRFDDPRLRIVEGDAQDLEQHLSANGMNAQVPLIVSGLPFTSLPAQVRESILSAIARALTPGGSFLLYQYSQAMRPHLLDHFSRVESHWEFRNIPPAVCVCCVP